MNRHDFNKYLEQIKNEPGCEFIVKIRYKYDCETGYRVTHEYLYYDFSYDTWVWENDWYEGEEDIDFCGIVKIDDIKEFKKI